MEEWRAVLQELLTIATPRKKSRAMGACSQGRAKGQCLPTAGTKVAVRARLISILDCLRGRAGS
eukprot:scaffold19061_cov31-Tisochrysis_lutea.AAC.6